MNLTRAQGAQLLASQRAKVRGYPVSDVVETAPTRSTLEERFVHLWRSCGGPDPVEQHRPHASRKWRLDFAWPDVLVAVEIHGDRWHGRHTRGDGFLGDRRKMNACARLGWMVFELCGDDVTYEAIEPVCEAIFSRRLNSPSLCNTRAT